MTDERDEHGNFLPDVQRLTSVGRFIRATSIDELPQFINVLMGQRPAYDVRDFDNRIKYMLEIADEK